MKTILILSLISAVFAKDISQYIEQKIDAENENEVGVAFQIPNFPMPDQNGIISGPDFRFQLTPGAMENQGFFVNQQPQAMESMPVRFPGVNMPGMNNMYPGMNNMYPGMNNMYPGMPGMDNNMYPGYPGFPQSQESCGNSCGCLQRCQIFWWMPCQCAPCMPSCPCCQQPTETPTTTTQIITTTVTETPLPTFPQEIPTQPPSNPCPCQPICPPCLPWFNCGPCNMCPCQSTPPPQNTPAPTTIPPTTTTLAPTTTLQTVTQEIPTQPPNNCVPCRPCNPCSIWWMCPPCNCNNGCQTVPPAPTVSPTIAPPSNNCPCVCAPCNPWAQNCPPCPSNCPCN